MIEFILFCLVYTIGFIAGYLANKQSVQSGVTHAVGSIRGIKYKLTTGSTAPTGVVKTLTAQQLYERREQPLKYEAKQEMKKTLDSDPILIEHKRRLEAIRKANLAQSL